MGMAHDRLMVGRGGGTSSGSHRLERRRLLLQIGPHEPVRRFGKDSMAEKGFASSADSFSLVVA